MLCSTHTCVVCLGYAGIARSLYIARLRGKKPAYAGGRAQAYLIHKFTSSCVRKLWAGAEAGWGALASGCEGGQRGPCPRPSVGPPTRCIQRAFIASY